MAKYRVSAKGEGRLVLTAHYSPRGQQAVTYTIPVVQLSGVREGMGMLSKAISELRPRYTQAGLPLQELTDVSKGGE